jgi:catechol 2,3-dioxygenase-like lactoylglutathione lyase family enzyme
MPLKLDHVVIAVDDLDKAIQDYRSLGFTVIPGGVHANRATHNALIAFSDGTYIELLAATGDAPLPNMIDFSRMLQDGEGLAGFALSTQEIEAEARRLQQEGFTVGDITEGSRIKDGRTMEWRLALIEDGFAPFLIQDTTPREWRVPGDPAAITHQNHAVGIPAVEYAVRDMDVAISHFTHLLALPVPDSPGSYNEIGCIVLNRYVSYHSQYAPAEREKAMDAAPGSSDFALFSIHLNREEANKDAFTPDRTHGVRFHQRASSRR